MHFATIPQFISELMSPASLTRELTIGVMPVILFQMGGTSRSSGKTRGWSPHARRLSNWHAAPNTKRGAVQLFIFGSSGFCKSSQIGYQIFHLFRLQFRFVRGHLALAVLGDGDQLGIGMLLHFG